jgi:hypothetical protein
MNLPAPVEFAGTSLFNGSSQERPFYDGPTCQGEIGSGGGN